MNSGQQKVTNYSFGNLGLLFKLNEPLAWCGARDSLPAESYFSLKVALQMGLSRNQGCSITFQAADHQCSFQGRNDQSRYFLRIHTSPNLSALDSAIDDRAKTIAPFVEAFTSTFAQDRIAVVRIDGCIQERATSGDGWAPINKIRNELLELVDTVGDSVKIVHPRVQDYLPGIV